MSGNPTANVRQKALSKLLTALLAVVFVGTSLVLPPVANLQLAHIEKTLQKPLIALIAALVIFALAAWSTRVPVAIALVMVVVLAIQIPYFLVTTAPGRSASGETQSWRAVPVASGASGIAKNVPDLFGQASLIWSDSNISLKLSSTTGTTQHGFHLAAGDPSSDYYFRARVDKVHGGPDVLCPLIFGIRSTRDYYTFRLQDAGENGSTAIVYHIVPISPTPDSGFHAQRVDYTTPLPYVNNWNIITPAESTQTTMAIRVSGNRYTFFVNDREVFSDVIDDAPPHVTAVGVTILDNNTSAEAECDFTGVTLRTMP